MSVQYKVTETGACNEMVAGLSLFSRSNSLLRKSQPLMSKSNTVFELLQRESFIKDLFSVPKKVQTSLLKRIFTDLRAYPFQTADGKIKKLKEYKDLYRYRVSDNYRLIYKVDKQAGTVDLLILDHRGVVYGRLDSNKDGTSSIRTIANIPEILEAQPSEEAKYEAKNKLELDMKIEEVNPQDGKSLPNILTAETLTNWQVPTKFHKALASISNEGELLAAPVTENTLLHIMNKLWPVPVEEVLQKPSRIIPSISKVDGANNDIEDLESCLLRLDDEQQDYVDRFNKPRPRGPWLLKGGPGSGKSTIALYCIKQIMDVANAELPFGDRPLRILFTTYTHALNNASESLLRRLIGGGGGNGHVVTVKIVDKLLSDCIPGAVLYANAIEPIIEKIIEKFIAADSKFGFSKEDRKFIAREIEWVISGQGLSSLEAYLTLDRIGQGRVLGHKQRRQVWALFEEVEKIIGQQGKMLSGRKASLAIQKTEDADKYDYVFIDEAQDLTPIAIRFCISLCRNASNVFLTADLNQSIYGNGMSWAKVAKDLKFQGRARILRRNYRCTKEIWDAITQLAPDAEDTDRETLDVEAVYSGSGRNPEPLLVTYSDEDLFFDRLNTYLHESLIQERVTSGSAAVLCPTHDAAKAVAKRIDKKFNPKYMTSTTLNLKHPGVKVLTMHASKGLEFPVVAITGVPFSLSKGKIDAIERNSGQKRLFFVACSRAMRKLIVFTNKRNPSRFIDGLTDEYWEIEDQATL